MQLLTILTLLTTLTTLTTAAPTPDTSDAPSGHEVEILGFTYGGSGCPSGTVGSQLSSDLTILTLIYDQFIAQEGPGIQPIESRKNCQVNVKLQFPQGWQFSVVEADYRGHATIPKGATGTVKATYYFSGNTQQISSTKDFPGPIDADYLKSDVFGVESTVWSPCGTEGMLNINSAVQLSPLSSQQAALLTSDSTDLKFTQIQHLQWRKC